MFYRVKELDILVLSLLIKILAVHNFLQKEVCTATELSPTPLPIIYSVRSLAVLG